MSTEMITVKMKDVFLEEVDQIVEEEGYQNRTEFIRDALREKIEEIELQETMKEISHLKNSANQETTSEEYEETRKKAFEKLSKEL